MDAGIRARARRRQRLRWWRYNVEYPLRGWWGWITFPIRHPILWVYCRRVDLHCWFGLPMPPSPKARFPM